MKSTPKIRRAWGALVIVGAAACSGSGFDDVVPGEERTDPPIDVSNGASPQESAPAPPSAPNAPPSPLPPNDAAAPPPDAAPPPAPGFPGPWDGGWIPPLDLDAGFIPKNDGGYKPPKNDGGFSPKLDGGISGPFDGGFLPF